MPTSPRPTSPLRVAVYGSCVARDTVEAAAPGQLDLVAYIARQSLLSSGSGASPHFPEDAQISSDFQRRMMRADFDGDLESRLDEVAGQVDVLLWDLADERHGVHLFEDGGVATRSIDLISTPSALAAVEGTEHLPFGTDEHFAAWTQRADAFLDHLRDLDLLERTIVLQVPWALITKDGAPTPWSMGVAARDANEAYRRYYRHLQGRGIAILELQPLGVLADPDHRWGTAPFHYTPEVYAEILERLATEHGLSIPAAAPPQDVPAQQG